MEGVETRKHKETYLEPKKKAIKAAYQVKYKAERKRFEAFKIAKSVVITNQDIIGEQWIRNDDGLLAVSDENKKIACES